MYLYSGNASSGTREYVMVEWGSQRAESAYSQISKEAMEARCKHLVGILHQSAITDNGFRVLDCLGYTPTEGRLPNGKSHPLIGFVYRLPPSSSKSTVPVTLREIIKDAYHSEETQIPTLDDRYRLAYVLANALYQLHCAGWIHQKISSYNNLFFPSPSTGALDLTKPFICGWQYARPDHWAKATEGNEKFISETANGGNGKNIFGEGSFGLGDLEMYVHPDRLDHENGIPLFRRSSDVYSLGVTLVEIASWEPIMVLCDLEEREKMAKFEAYSNHSRLTWSKTVVDAVKRELGSEMGTVYQDAVRFCLEGTRDFKDRKKVGYEAIDQKVQAKQQDVGQLEPGIEKEFFLDGGRGTWADI